VSQYPVIYAGQRITADLDTSMLATEFFKTSNTDRSSTTTLANDPDLTATLEASAVYRVIFYLHFAAIDAARFKTAWTVPSGATGNRTAVGPDQGVILSSTSSGGTGRWGVHAFTTACTYGSRDSASNQCFAMEEGIVTTTNAGTLAIQWAQATSNATATRLAAGSSLYVRRLS
jgi:hypothetical protein